jgi:outer membrane receptor protein involved in Fe transport
MEDTMTLNLTGYWQFPIAGIVQGRLGVEAINVTNEQEVISINIATGQPDAGKVAYQAPREFRLQVGITF